MKKKSFKDFKNGFTLPEIMVVLALFAILAATALNSNFGSRKQISALTNDSLSLSLEIRDMQTRTLSFVNDSNSPSNYNGYGVYFDLVNANTIKTFYNTGSLISFNFSDISSLFNLPSEKIVFTNPDYISRICLNSDCKNSNQNLDFTKLAISFIKPRQYAIFFVSKDGIDFRKTLESGGPTNISSVCIEMATGQNYFRNIYVNYAGQISESVGMCK
jgi:prepilin-type N-terminal cleavage/methylation domain-containing protein